MLVRGSQVYRPFWRPGQPWAAVAEVAGVAQVPVPVHPALLRVEPREVDLVLGRPDQDLALVVDLVTRRLVLVEISVALRPEVDPLAHQLPLEQGPDLLQDH